MSPLKTMPFFCLSLALCGVSCGGNQISMQEQAANRRSIATSSIELEKTRAAPLPSSEEALEKEHGAVAANVGNDEAAGAPEVDAPQSNEVPLEVSDLSSQPVMLNGAFLAACQWSRQFMHLRCRVNARGATAVPSAEELDLTLTLADSQKIDPSQYVAKFTSNAAELQIDLDFTAPLTKLAKLELSPRLEGGGPGLNFATFEASFLQALPEVVVYDGTAYAGQAKAYGVGEYTLAGGTLSLLPSSLKIPAGLAVELCDRPDRLGLCASFYGDLPNLGGVSARNAYMRVYESAPFITLFEHFLWEGAAESHSFGSYAPTSLALYGRISGFHVPPDIRLEVCTAADGLSGCSMVGGDGDFNYDGLNDKIAFIRVLPAAP